MTCGESITSGAGYVTVTVDRKVIPGQEENYEHWISNISRAASSFPGHLGVNVLRPAKGYTHYTIIYRFDNPEHADAWSHSEERKKWTDKLSGIVEGDTNIRSVTGLEAWFDLPTISVEKHPVRWRMCVVLFVVVFLMISILSFILSPLLGDINQYLRTAVVVCLQVTLMTYLVMPKVTAILKHWLYR